VRPDFILLRVLARNLICWDAVEASEEWMLSQLPPFLREAEQPDEDLRFARANIVAGACLSLGFRFAGSGNAAAHATIAAHITRLLKKRTSVHPQVRQADAAGPPLIAVRRRATSGPSAPCTRRAWPRAHWRWPWLWLVRGTWRASASSARRACASTTA
jgi:hypothetical protein